MKKAFFVALATLVAMSQFGCSGLGWGGGGLWSILQVALEVAQTADVFNVIPGLP